MNNDWELPQINYKCQTTDPRSSETGQNKTEKSTLRYITLKLQKIKDKEKKEKNLKMSKGKTLPIEKQ